MIVRPLIPQQSTVNGKRKVISRYENGGEAANTGIGNFAKQLRAFGERSPVYGIGGYGDLIDFVQRGFSKLPISPGYFLDKEVQTDPEVAQTLRNKANPLPTSEEVTSFLESKGVEFTDKEGVGDFLASVASPVTLLALPSAIASAARQVPKLVEKIPEVMESLYARFPALDPKMYIVPNQKYPIRPAPESAFFPKKPPPNFVMGEIQGFKFDPTGQQYPTGNFLAMSKEGVEDATNLNASKTNIRINSDAVREEALKNNSFVPQTSMTASFVSGKKQPYKSETKKKNPNIGRKYHTNLLTNKKGSPAKWEWHEGGKGYENSNQIATVQQGTGEHFYTVEVDLPKGSHLSNFPNKEKNPRLRPTVNGDIILGNKIGEVMVYSARGDNLVEGKRVTQGGKRYKGRIHPIYDKIIMLDNRTEAVKKAMGGEVSGVGTLNDTARNMFKQPRGVVTLSSVARNMFI
tara:strand:+ start:880 stop:2265 length:1386 start_codon:yes stop_codon:yes gene_type:complete